MTSDFKPEPGKFFQVFWYNKREETVTQMEVCYGENKAFLEAHYKRYILTICLLWFLMFFLPWDWQIGGVSVYYFVMRKLFVVLAFYPSYTRC